MGDRKIVWCSLCKERNIRLCKQSMKLQNVFADKEEPTPQKRASVIIDPHPKRERVYLDSNGNEINPKTKQIINKAEE